MFSINFDKKYWLEYDKTKGSRIDFKLINENSHKLNKSLQIAIRQNKEDYHKFFFKNKADNDFDDFKSKITKMENEIKSINLEIFKFNFKKIYEYKTIQKIMIVHSLLLLLNPDPSKSILDVDKIDANLLNGKCIFLEQFILDKEDSKRYGYKQNSIRIFHILQIEENNKLNIILYPLFIDSKHQIIPHLLKGSKAVKNLISIMVESGCKTFNDLKNKFGDMKWLDQNKVCVEDLQKFFKYQSISELQEFLNIPSDLSKFIDWLFEKYIITTCKK